jgi:hypothetical protein
LEQNADPHIMDLAGNDACDHALRFGITQQYPLLGNCDKSLRSNPVFDEMQKKAQMADRFGVGKY